MQEELEKNERDFLLTLHNLKSDIDELFLSIAVGKEYNNESHKLYEIYKLLKAG